jgi:adenine-specific DNA-methyltransferase
MDDDMLTGLSSDSLSLEREWVGVRVRKEHKASTGFARTLRRNMTDAEKRIWSHLKGRSFAEYKFRRQHPIGPYIADFACPACKLVVELDGGQHALNQARDERRSRELAVHGYRVIRFWDHEALSNTQGVLDSIYEALRAADRSSSPQPSPRRGEGEEEPEAPLPVNGRG